MELKYPNEGIDKNILIFAKLKIFAHYIAIYCNNFQQLYTIYLTHIQHIFQSLRNYCRHEFLKQIFFFT